MKKFKKFFTIFLLLLICFNLLACKKGGNQGGDTPKVDPIAEAKSEAIEELDDLFRMVNNIPMSDAEKTSFENMKTEAVSHINTLTNEVEISNYTTTITNQFTEQLNVIIEAKRFVDNKLAAKIEVVALFNDLRFDRLSSADYAEFMQMRSTALAEIDAAANDDEIIEKKNAAIAAFDAKQATYTAANDLADEKVSAISRINDLYDSLNPNLFSEQDLSDLRGQADTIISAINQALTVAHVKTASSDGEDALEASINSKKSANELNNAKQSATASFNALFNTYFDKISTLLNNDEKDSLNGVKTNVASAIEAATTIANVNSAKDAGETQLNEAITTLRAANLDVARSLALADVEALYNQLARELIGETDLAEFDEMKTTALANINAAADVAGVSTALDDANTAFQTKADAISTDIDVSKVKMFGSLFTYDGEEHSIFVSSRNLPAGLVIEYVGNGQTEVGVHPVTAYVKNSVGKLLKTLKDNITISKPKQKVNDVKFTSTSYEWKKDTTFTLEATGVPEGVNVRYENNTLTEPGKVEAMAKLYDKYDGELLKTLTAVLTVNYQVIHNEDVFASSENVYSGEEFTTTLASSEASKYKSVNYLNNTATIPGTYPVYAVATTTDDEIVEYRAYMVIENAFSQEFSNYTNDMFVYFLSGDQATLNLFMVDYEAFGFEHQDATWYAYERYTDEDHESDLKEITRLKNEFSAYNRAGLNSYQKVDYDKLKDEIEYLDFLINNPKYILMRQTYIDQFGGYAGDIPTTMEAYQVRTKQDIEDIISYIDSVDEAFASYVDYALDRAEAGYPFTNFTINNMIDYLDGVTKRNAKEDDEDKDKPYYLIAIMENKIKDSKEALNLTDSEVNDYIARLDKAFESFLQAHIDLADQLAAKCLNKATDKQANYLASYGEKGKVLYELLLRNRLGITMPMEEYIEFIDTTLTKYYNEYSSYSTTSRGSSIMDGEVMILDSNDPNDILDFLKDEFAKTLVPDLQNDPAISVAYMDKTVTANTTTLAYYMKSALDSTDKEFIHLNGDALGKDYLETIKTLAHEGYPGHLFAYVFTKENNNISNFVRVSTNTGHGEGWAKYVECALCDYLAETRGGDWVGAMNKSKFWDLFVYQIYTRIDVGIEYEGWGVDEVFQFMKNQNLSVTEDTAKEIIQDLVEMPGQYAAYGYGQALFYELHDEAKEILGSNYDEIEFNTMLLEHGWIGLSDVQELYDNYMKQKCFLCGIEFDK